MGRKVASLPPRWTVTRGKPLSLERVFLQWFLLLTCCNIELLDWDFPELLLCSHVPGARTIFVYVDKPADLHSSFG